MKQQLRETLNAVRHARASDERCIVASTHAAVEVLEQQVGCVGGEMGWDARRASCRGLLPPPRSISGAATLPASSMEESGASVEEEGAGDDQQQGVVVEEVGSVVGARDGLAQVPPDVCRLALALVRHEMVCSE